jgi:mono/diheme cytochrome c family protein
VTANDAPSRTPPDGLWRWLLGGLVGGMAILGLLVGAYAVGYHRGEDQIRSTSAPTAPTTTRTTTPSPTTTPTAGPVPVTAALVARGKALYAADGCSACHSLTGGSGVGPSLKGIAGSTVTLANGQTVTADDAYLERSITDADAEIVKGYSEGVMSAAVAGYDLGGTPDDVRALVAFIKSQP